MLRWILVLLLIPFLDAVLLAGIAWQTGYFGLVGLLLVRAEGRRTIRKMQRTLAAGEPPTNELLDGALLIAAGAFLLTPGLVTDLLGFLLVLPPTRIPIRMAIKRFVVVPALDKRTDGFATGKVWTFGFPDEDPTPSGAGSDETVDLGREDYRVDADGEERYTIEFGDERTTDASDDLDGTRSDDDFDGTRSTDDLDGTRSDDDPSGDGDAVGR